jgi:hypothetical protein
VRPVVRDGGAGGSGASCYHDAAMSGPSMLIAAAVATALLGAADARAQAVEIAPFLGYRAGGELYEVVTGTGLDTSSPGAGVIVDAFIRDGTSVTFVYSRQRAQIGGAWQAPQAPSASLPVEHWHAGGSQELDGGVIRPFLGGTVGLTRFGGRNAETRFSVAGRGGVKFRASAHVGARFDASVYAVFVDGGIGRVACGSGFCAFDVDALIAWQGEFSAALTIAF